MSCRSREYEMVKGCDHCQEDTVHRMVDGGHERDSSNDYEECLECHWWKTGISDVQQPPMNVDEGRGWTDIRRG